MTTAIDGPTPIYAEMTRTARIDCRWTVGPIPKEGGHVCECNRLSGHRLPHECDCGAWFEGCGRERPRDTTPQPARTPRPASQTAEKER